MAKVEVNKCSKDTLYIYMVKKNGAKNGYRVISLSVFVVFTVKS